MRHDPFSSAPAAAPSVVSPAKPRTKTKKSATIDLSEIIAQIPDAAFAHLLQQSGVTLDNPREALATWCRQHPETRDWRQAWAELMRSFAPIAPEAMPNDQNPMTKPEDAVPLDIDHSVPFSFNPGPETTIPITLSGRLSHILDRARRLRTQARNDR